MSMHDYQSAVELMEQSPELKDFEPPQPEQMIDEAERALGVKFPPTYRRFLLDYGAGNFGAAEIYGLLGNGIGTEGIPNGVWYTLKQRAEAGIPDSMVVIGSDGMGGLYCIDCTSEGEEPPVVVVTPGRGGRPELVASDFGEYLLEAVQQELEL